jgi:hypothetical protein
MRNEIQNGEIIDTTDHGYVRVYDADHGANEILVRVLGPNRVDCYTVPVWVGDVRQLSVGETGAAVMCGVPARWS